MVELSVMGKAIQVSGHGSEDEPFILHGIKGNTPLAAAAEHAMIDNWMGPGNWDLLKTRLERPGNGQVLAVLTVLTNDENGQSIKGDIWFNIAEAYDI